jgi:hypothetical protein
MNKLSIYAVGDISFFGKDCDKPSDHIISSIEGILKEADLVIGNLESPLINEGTPILNKCTLRGNVEWGKVLKKMNVQLVSLANNHIMDYGPEGLFSTMNTLKAEGIDFVGAGYNQIEACAPRFITVKGIRIALIGRSSVIVSSPCYAQLDSVGAAFLDTDETIRTIIKSKENCDLVVVLIHWGLEEYSYPTPNQVELARNFIDAGADIILGHHPHVIQGVQKIGTGAVAYSLGNFLFNDFLWVRQGNGNPIPIVLSDKNRKGLILKVSYENNNLKLSYTFTQLNSSGQMILDISPNRKLELNLYSRILDKVFYKQWWKLYAFHREWTLRIKPIFSYNKILNKLWKIRIRHVKEFIYTLKKSSDIASGKTTNPYE